LLKKIQHTHTLKHICTLTDTLIHSYTLTYSYILTHSYLRTQVDGKDGVQILLKKIERRGLGVLYDGSAATLGRSVLQCAAVCCSVLQCVAVCCSVLQCVAVCCSVLHYVAVCERMLQYVAVCCSVLQCVAVCCNVLYCVLYNGSAATLGRWVLEYNKGLITHKQIDTHIHFHIPPFSLCFFVSLFLSLTQTCTHYNCAVHS